MTPRPPVVEALDQVGRPLRGLHGLRHLLLGAAAALVILAVTAWWSRLRGTESAVAVLSAWGGAVLALVVGGWLARRAMRRLSLGRIAELLEASGVWRRGALSTLLDPVAPNTSDMLRAVAERERAGEVQGIGISALALPLGTARRAGRRALVAVAIAGVALLASRPATGAPAGLWSPGRAWAALVSPLRLTAVTPLVARGTAGTLRLEAPGHRTARLQTRAPGEGWSERIVALDEAGEAVVETDPLRGDLLARFDAGGRSSAEVRIAVRATVFLGGLQVRAEYPTYLGRASELMPLTGDTLQVPVGTRLHFEGQVSVPVADARLVGPDGEVPLRFTGSRIEGVVAPIRSGAWGVVVRVESGGAVEADVPTIEIQVIPDQAPLVTIPLPGRDTVASGTLQVPLLIAIADDHGLVRAAVEWRRATGGVHRLPLPLPTGESVAEALLSTTLDLDALGLMAGDSIWYRALAVDNAPGGQQGVSPEYLVRIPTVGEQREAQDAAGRAVGQSLDSLAARAGRAQRQTEDLSRARPRPSATADSAGRGTLSADVVRSAEAAVQAQSALQRETARAAQEVDRLQAAARQQGLADSVTARQFDEIRALLQQAMTPELHQALADLQEALRELDPQATASAMRQLAAQQDLFRQALEQARELFKRAAMEHDLTRLQQASAQLAEAQAAQVLPIEQAAQVRADSGRAGTAADAAAIDRQDVLGAQADSLAQALAKAADRVPSDSVRAGLQRAADQVQQAADQMRQAADAARAGSPQEARAEAEKARQTLAKVPEEVAEQREALQEAMQEEVLRALDRALTETARLTERQLTLTERLRRGGAMASTRAEQGLVDEALGRLIQQVATLSGQHAMVPQQIGIALAAARAHVRAAVEAVTTGTPDSRLAAAEAGQAVDAMALAGFSMLRARDRVSGSQSGSGLEDAIEAMQQAAEQQGAMAREAGQRMNDGETTAQQMMQMAMQQRAIANQLDRIQSGGTMPGAGGLGQEARELARALEASSLTEDIVQRQERLYRRMLDAGRQLQGEEEDDERRRATPPGATPARTPGLLDPQLRQGETGIHLPTWDTLQRLAPEERRRVLEYFRRLTTMGTGGP